IFFSSLKNVKIEQKSLRFSTKEQNKVLRLILRMQNGATFKVASTKNILIFIDATGNIKKKQTFYELACQVCVFSDLFSRNEIGGGQGIVRCNCRSQCITNRCGCRKSNLLINYEKNRKNSNVIIHISSFRNSTCSDLVDLPFSKWMKIPQVKLYTFEPFLVQNKAKIKKMIPGTAYDSSKKSVVLAVFQ
ncbi:hypothetical protein BpHYR1_013186, partial [Brachionus plicatilis]